MSLRISLAWTFVLTLWCAGTPHAAWAADSGDVTQEKVDKSIKRGVEFMLKARNADGTWENKKDYLASDNVSTYGAETSLCLYSLLHVGESGEDPRLNPHAKELAKAIKFVTDLKPQSTYACSLQACALALLPKDPPVKDALKRARDFLVNTTLARGGHTYSVDYAIKHPGIFDNSNSNYALIGLAAINDAEVPGVTIPLTYWQSYEAFWRKNQNADGGWGYAPETRPKSYNTMTAAGVASLLLCRQYTQAGDISVSSRVDKSLEAGLTELSHEYDPSTDNLYYIYTLERIALAGGLKDINGKDWYTEAAGVLLRSQHDDGGWSLHAEMFFQGNVPDAIYTAYALLFLERGQSPVLFNKLKYDGAWDARQRDDANLTEWISKTLETPLAWQSVSFKGAGDWTDAPVLLITGSRDPKFTPEDIDRLRSYVMAGGMIFSTADAGSEEFTKAMETYAEQMVGNGYQGRILPPDHPLFNLWATVTSPPRLWGLSNGTRELWVHSPIDMGSAWQRKAREAKAMFEVPANIYLYVTGKGSPGHRLDTLAVKPSAAQTVRTINIARVQYDGNFDPEPGAWARMTKLAQAQFHTELKLSASPPGKLDPKSTPIAHLTGTAAVQLDDAAKKALADFVNNGGTLLIDACAGNNAFNDSVKPLLADMFKDQKLETIPVDDPIYSDQKSEAVKIDKVDWRRYTRARDGSAPGEHPRLQGIKKDNRWAVIFSADDLTSGLLGTNTWGIAGYTPKSAQQIVRNILLYSNK